MRLCVQIITNKNNITSILQASAAQSEWINKPVDEWINQWKNTVQSQWNGLGLGTWYMAANILMCYAQGSVLKISSRVQNTTMK